MITWPPDHLTTWLPDHLTLGWCISGKMPNPEINTVWFPEHISLCLFLSCSRFLPVKLQFFFFPLCWPGGFRLWLSASAKHLEAVPIGKGAMEMKKKNLNCIKYNLFLQRYSSIFRPEGPHWLFMTHTHSVIVTHHKNTLLDLMAAAAQHSFCVSSLSSELSTVCIRVTDWPLKGRTPSLCLFWEANGIWSHAGVVKIAYWIVFKMMKV